MNFDLVENRNVSSKDDKNSVLSYMTDCTKLKSMVSFNRKMSFSEEVFVYVNAKGLMKMESSYGFIVCNRRSTTLKNLNGLLIWDMFKSHLSFEKISNN